MEHHYLHTHLKKLQADESFEENEQVNDYLFQLMLKYYNELSDEASLEKICFEDPYQSLEFIQAITGLSLEELNQKYDIQLIDASGLEISLDEAKSYRNIFMDLETNYNMHAEFLIYIYKEMQRLNNLFSIQAFSA